MNVYRNDWAEQIVEALRRLTEEGGEGNFLVIHADQAKNYYIQFSACRDDPLLRCEAVSNEHLERRFALALRQISHLLSMGWNSPNPKITRNFYRDWTARDHGDRRAIAREVLDALEFAYGWSPDKDLVLELNLSD